MAVSGFISLLPSRSILRKSTIEIVYRGNGEAELYTYLPLLPSNTRALLSVQNSHENSDYGFSVGRGAWRFDSGTWCAIAVRAKLNEVGREDGACHGH